MSKVNYPESYKPTFKISNQLDTLIHQMGVKNMRDTVDPEITNAEIDDLLEKIEIESGRKKYLMEIVRSIVHDEKITDPNQILNVKIQVLLDNLGRKLCRCTEKDIYTEGVKSDKVRNKEGLCRNSIFHGRNIDYITHDCGEPPVDRMRYKYGMGPLLRPALSSDSKVLLRRYSKKEKTATVQAVEVPAVEVPASKSSAIPKVVASAVDQATKSCTLKGDTGRCVLGEPNMPSNCVYNVDTKRCRKL